MTKTLLAAWLLAAVVPACLSSDDDPVESVESAATACCAVGRITEGSPSNYIGCGWWCSGASEIEILDVPVGICDGLTAIGCSELQ